MSTIKEVYLPLATLVDTETGELVSRPYVDFDGAPWMYADSEANVYDSDASEWETDRDAEEQAIVAIIKTLDRWGDA